jgi:lipopolysaccharide export system protein LptA
MKIRHPSSIAIIFFYLLANGLVIRFALQMKDQEVKQSGTAAALAPEFTEIEDLEYFHLRESVPQLSVIASRMQSQGEELADFFSPRGKYNYPKKDQVLNYQADLGLYNKNKDVLELKQNALVTSDEGDYRADKVRYLFKKDLIIGSGNVAFKGEDPKTKDQLEIYSDKMRAYPQKKLVKFNGQVHGSIQRFKKYEGKTNFSSNSMQLEGEKSLAHLEGDVKMLRQDYTITARKADIYLENYNKSLKYFVLNDDVKVTEKIQTPSGESYRRAFSERLEGFGVEQKMILSGAPRVEHGDDVVKGYRITIREKMDLIEVDDAMSDVKVKRDKN